MRVDEGKLSAHFCVGPVTLRRLAVPRSSRTREPTIPTAEVDVRDVEPLPPGVKRRGAGVFQRVRRRLKMSDTLLFAFCLFDTGALLFLLVYYVRIVDPSERFARS